MIAAVNCTATASEIVAANGNRRLLVIQNVSDTNVYLKIDSSTTEVTTSAGIRLLAGGPALIIVCDKQGELPYAVRGIHGGSGNKVLLITEDSFL